MKWALTAVLIFCGCQSVSTRKPPPDKYIGIQWESEEFGVAYYRLYVEKKNGKVRTYEFPADVDCWNGRGVRCWLTAVNSAGLESEPSRSCP